MTGTCPPYLMTATSKRTSSRARSSTTTTPPAPQRAAGTALAVIRDKRAQFAARHAVYVGLGLVVLCRRAWESRVGARYDRWLRAAEAEGDHERLLEVEQRLAAFRKDRHQRRMDWVDCARRRGEGRFSGSSAPCWPS